MDEQKYEDCNAYRNSGGVGSNTEALSLDGEMLHCRRAVTAYLISNRQAGEYKQSTSTVLE